MTTAHPTPESTPLPTAPPTSPTVGPCADPFPDPAEVTELLAELSARGGLEFEAYQRAGLLRRIARRMERIGVGSLSAYRALLAADPDEHGRLCEAIQVHRTDFFRDPAVWAYLASEVVPRLLAAKGTGEPIRAWSAGCATGEEAYTLAMILVDALGHAMRPGRVQVLATDVSEPALARARYGRYRAERLAGVPTELLPRYFQPAGGDWLVVRGELRACVVFAPNDLLRDPPLGRMDLIACRNTLMYFTPESQAPVLARLYLGLREGGLLVTGLTERPTVWSNLFEPEHDRSRVYRRAEGRAGEALASLPYAGAERRRDRSNRLAASYARAANQLLGPFAE